MKKKKPKVLPAALLPNKKKKMLDIVNDPKKLEQVMDFIKASSNFFEHSKTMKSNNMVEWIERCINILPDDLNNKDNFIKEFKLFMDNYGDKINATTNE